MLTKKPTRIALAGAGLMMAAAPVCGQGAGGQDRMSPLTLEGLDLRVDFEDVFFGQVGSSAANAPDTVTPIWDRETNWLIEVQPYIWVPIRLDGDSTVNGLTVPLDFTISDMFDTFEGVALTLRVEAWNKDGWGLLFDGMYVNLDGEEVTGSSAFPQVDVEIEQGIIDLGGGYRLVDDPVGSDTNLHVGFDVLGGARVQILRQDITLRPGPDPGDDKAWVEPFIGGRVSLYIDRHWAVVVRGDVSGFGIGDASDLTWNLLVGVGYQFTNLFQLRVGYRVLDIDYEDGSGFSKFGFDATMHGPWLGFTFVF
ncbi:MAG: hypothetical protein ACYS15_16285 [Planctomycetota bacterium]